MYGAIIYEYVHTVVVTGSEETSRKMIVVDVEGTLPYHFKN